MMFLPTLKLPIGMTDPFDVIVLDLMMPDRSGFDIYRALQTRLVGMPPVIMLSAVTGMQQRIDARDLGDHKISHQTYNTLETG